MWYDVEFRYPAHFKIFAPSEYDQGRLRWVSKLHGCYGTVWIGKPPEEPAFICSAIANIDGCVFLGRHTDLTARVHEYSARGLKFYFETE